MTLPLPTSLSPSKVSSFTSCPLAFRFSTIDRLPEPPSPQATKGTLVHRVLELLFWEEPAGRRTLAAALEKLPRAWAETLVDPENEGLDLAGEAGEAMLVEADNLLRRYFDLEDPNTVRMIGTELRLEAQIGSLRLRGIIDRLELDDNDNLVVTDYKSGKAPRVEREQDRLGGVNFYAFLCEQALGQVPVRVQLLYLGGEPCAISKAPTEQSIRGLRNRAGAVWSAVENACSSGDFRPHPSALCGYCSFQAYCPAFGGDPAAAEALRPVVVEPVVLEPA
ncbi:MAG TPA: PD-(D/E)XK nuclease family protein [Acidimicrobiales bacterium]|nr:PD-(D/E)XK nuclease family protein [Acidimicrobiales bacterium]